MRKITLVTLCLMTICLTLIIVVATTSSDSLAATTSASVASSYPPRPAVELTNLLAHQSD